MRHHLVILFVRGLFVLLTNSTLLFQQINQMIADVPKDGGGAIDYEEFENMTAKIGEMDTKEELMKAFQIIDQDKNGKICVSDIKRIAKELGERFTDREIHDMVETADIDGKLIISCSNLCYNMEIFAYAPLCLKIFYVTNFAMT
ncbi:hypothetical protein HN51_008069 [Arachis hypogaea]